MNKGLRKLMLWLTAIICSVNIGCCRLPLKPISATHPTSSIVANISDSTVALIKLNDDTVVPFCTGVWVAEDRILTASHCVTARVTELTNQGRVVEAIGLGIDYISQAEVTGMFQPPTKTHEAEVVAFDDVHDLALLRASLTRPKHSFVTIASEAPTVGSDLHLIGQTAGMYWTYSRGYVSGLRSASWMPPSALFTGPFIQISSSAWFGNSGGGAFNSKGELVGLASFMPRVPNTMFFISCVSIGPFLKEASSASTN